VPAIGLRQRVSDRLRARECESRFLSRVQRSPVKSGGPPDRRSIRNRPYFRFFENFDLRKLLRATAWRTSALKADSSTSSPSWMSIARRTFPSRLELKRRAGSFRDAPLANVSFTTFL